MARCTKRPNFELFELVDISKFGQVSMKNKVALPGTRLHMGSKAVNAKTSKENVQYRRISKSSKNICLSLLSASFIKFQ